MEAIVTCAIYIFCYFTGTLVYTMWNVVATICLFIVWCFSPSSSSLVQKIFFSFVLFVFNWWIAMHIYCWTGWFINSKQCYTVDRHNLERKMQLSRLHGRGRACAREQATKHEQVSQPANKIKMFHQYDTSNREGENSKQTNEITCVSLKHEK